MAVGLQNILLHICWIKFIILIDLIGKEILTVKFMTTWGARWLKGTSLKNHIYYVLKQTSQHFFSSFHASNLYNFLQPLKNIEWKSLNILIYDPTLFKIGNF